MQILSTPLLPTHSPSLFFIRPPPLLVLYSCTVRNAAAATAPVGLGFFFMTRVVAVAAVLLFYICASSCVMSLFYVLAGHTHTDAQ